jgi:hypothetical protein
MEDCEEQDSKLSQFDGSGKVACLKTMFSDIPNTPIKAKDRLPQGCLRHVEENC